MDNSRKWIIFFIFFVYTFPIWISLVHTIDFSNPFDYARITDVDYKAVVVDEPGGNAKINVTERLTFDVHAASKDNLFWELWRDLPEQEIDGLLVDYNVKSVKQILENGEEIVYDRSRKLYWDDYDYVEENTDYGPGKWYHSKGPYNEYLRRYECVLFYVNGLYRENVVFEIEYEMNNASFKYDDCSELYLCMYSEDTIKHLNSFNAEILFKNEDMPDKNNYYAHTYGTRAVEFPFTESKTKNPGYTTFSISLDEDDLKFSPHTQYLEFALVSYGDDKHIFTEYAPRNDYTYDDALVELQDEHNEFIAMYEEAKHNKQITFIFCVAGSILVIIMIAKKKRKIEKKYNFYTPSNSVDYFRDIPSDLDPAFAAKLTFIKSKKQKDVTDSFSAILLSLIRKKYVSLEKVNNLEDWELKNTKIIVNKDALAYNNIFKNDETPALYEELTINEKEYFRLINKYAPMHEISMKDFQKKVASDYQNTNSFVSSLKRNLTTLGISKDYFQETRYEKPREELQSLASTYNILAFIFLIIVNAISYPTKLDLAYGGFFLLGFTMLFSAIYLKRLGRKYVLLTQFGEDEYARWRGLYKFLNSYTLMHERTTIELPIWEKYLVYATAFGISKKVIKAININCPEFASSPMLSNSYCRSVRFYTTSHSSFRSATRSAYSSAYGGGSYSVGGRGGGGGGGGH